MSRILSALGDLCSEVAADQYVPNQKWFRDMAYGALTAQSLKLSEIARALDEDDSRGRPRGLEGAGPGPAADAGEVA